MKNSNRAFFCLLLYVIFQLAVIFSFTPLFILNFLFLHLLEYPIIITKFERHIIHEEIIYDSHIGDRSDDRRISDFLVNFPVDMMKNG